ncbi:SulP family inorganic anion transporter [Sedimenticola selenatireducens]|uniref:Sodium-independent anion transporter n=1 Tax=Sedimenticola selenatireducens TaxID=191960 RepID=A0A2N6CZ40_9GAMM|nr:SulP family inorganic anion transporter [Sedimenticola selenatireducens]PLX62637.1 MAG: sodium-independent anion transporter [Sedimenticola selenatireducens]
MPLVNGFHLRNLQGDIYGGLTAAVVALPLALAMGVSSGAGPIAGIYGAIFVGFFAALFGGTPAQVSGPTGPMTVVMAMIFTQYTGMFPDNPAHGAALAFGVVVLGGVFQIIFGLLRVGKFIELVPHPVISGFMSGIGVIIILLQIGPLVGFDSPARPLLAMQAIPDFLSNIQPDAATLGLLTLIVVYTVPAFLPQLNKLIPAPLIALILGTTAVWFLFPGSSAPLLGEIPTGIPTLQIPAFDLLLLPGMIKSALPLAALGAIDSLLTSLVADNITRGYHKSDRELIGQGIGNTVAGFFGGLPGAGATMRTVVNIKAGGRTPISGALHSLILLGCILGAGGLASHIPKAVLAGILIKVGTDIIDWDYFKRLRQVPLSGIVKMLVVLLLTVFVDLMIAVATGMVMASMLFMKEMVDLQLKSISTITDPDQTETPLSDEEKLIIKAARGDILLYHLAGPMSFGAAKEMSRRLAQFDKYRALVLDLSDVAKVDFTSSRALDDMIFNAQSTGRQVFLVGGRPQVYEMLQKQGVLGRLNEWHQHNRRLSALQHAAASIGIPAG